jgi:signal transduction histidine kinase
VSSSLPEPAEGIHKSPELVALEAAARGEHSLRSLLELSRHVSNSTDLFATFDLLLLTVLGQLGAGRSAMWLLSGDRDEHAVLTRSHGFDRKKVKAVVKMWEPEIRGELQRGRGPLQASKLEPAMSLSSAAMLREAGIALFAPLLVGGDVLGWLAIGPRLNGRAYATDDLAIIQTALGMVSASLHNTLLNRRLSESNRQLQRSNVHLQELDRLKTEFISNVNHEIRTPVAVVIASLECLSALPYDQPAHDLLDAALVKARQLESLLENLLSFSEAINERLPCHSEPEDIAALVHAYYEERLPGITAELREFSCQAAAELPRGLVDRQRLHQILDQLLDNAIKFTPRGAHIRLEVGCAPHAPHEGGQRIRVTVADNGPGIPPERMASLFESFEQVDGSSTRGVGGLGIGLAFAQQLARRMDCALQAASELGHGATFELLIPACRSSSEAR